ncbi:hypothetical protein ACP4OV_011628 [Aristida adscensionis]
MVDKVYMLRRLLSCSGSLDSQSTMHCRLIGTPLLVVVVAASLAAASLSVVSETGDGDGGQVVMMIISSLGGTAFYVVYLGNLPAASDSESDVDQGFSAMEAAHHDLLNQVLGDDSSALDRIFHSYKRSFNGFAARLTEQEAHRFSGMEGIVSVFPSRKRELLTTRSWDFLGFPQTPPEALPLEGEVIVGMLDSGVWPDSPSFSDEGFGPPPARWKGACQNFTCNNKIIGARVYDIGSNGGAGLSPLDRGGHGSHTASIAAGRAVGNVSLGGLAAGTARGAVPGARLAVYKVCHDGACRDADILAAFDDAIADGVDVISFSVGNPAPSPYFEDAAAIGAFHAMSRGVLTSAAAGNSGLDGGRVTNVAPWMLSVGASSIDRRFVDRIVLGNGKAIVGASINTFPVLQNAPLAFPINGSCQPEGLAGGSYQGKIVLCLAGNSTGPDDGTGPFMAGAAGAVIVGHIPSLPQAVILPALVVTQDQLDEIVAYVKSTSNPVGTIDSTETTVDPQAPIAASFSSPGPNLITPWILKPDVAAPGIDIIAAWTLLSSQTGEPNDKRRVPYNILSGTSMACPHASGAAAYVKSYHRDWSPAMIISALVTTATPMSTPGNSEISQLKHGAGQLNPAMARDPGLVYDASESDYVAMLCAQGYNATQLSLITGSSNATACAATAGSGGGDLNYPTMAAHVAPGRSFSVSFARTVTNVGAPRAVYDLELDAPVFLRVTVLPGTLEFDAQNQEASYTVSVSGVAPAADEVALVTVVWSDGEHEVRSPVVLYTVNVETPAT